MLLTIIILILKRLRYFLTALALAAIMFALSSYLMVFNITDKSIAAYAIMNGTWYTITSVALTLFISMLFGIYAALWLARRDLIKHGQATAGALLGASGALGGIIAAGCPACGVPLLALLGAPLALYALPFKGIEIKVISLILLFLSIYWLAENVHQQISGTCESPKPALH